MTDPITITYDLDDVDPDLDEFYIETGRLALAMSPEEAKNLHSQLGYLLMDYNEQVEQ